MKLDTLHSYPITPGPWKACREHENFQGSMYDLDADELAEYAARPFVRVESATERVVVCHDLAAIKPADALAIAKVPELLQIALWAEAAFGFLASRTALEDRLEFERRFRETKKVLDDIRWKP